MTIKPSLADDVMRGAADISEFVFGTPKKRRGVYHLVETGGLPVFRMGSTICARKSTLETWIAEQEARALTRKGEDD